MEPSCSRAIVEMLHEAVLPRLDAMVDKGVVTTEPVRGILSRPAAL